MRDGAELRAPLPGGVDDLGAAGLPGGIVVLVDADIDGVLLRLCQLRPAHKIPVFAVIFGIAFGAVVLADEGVILAVELRKGPEL